MNASIVSYEGKFSEACINAFTDTLVFCVPMLWGPHMRLTYQKTRIRTLPIRWLIPIRTRMIGVPSVF